MVLVVLDPFSYACIGHKRQRTQPLLRGQTFPQPLHFPETGPISTITGKPETEFRPTGIPGAGFGTLAKTGFVDDPQTKINIFAEARGISPDR